MCFSPRGHNLLPRSHHHIEFVSCSTLEKTKLCYHPTLSSVLRKSFQWIVHDHSPARFLGRCPQGVAPLYPLSLSLAQLSHSRDLDFHSFSSPGSLTSRMADSREHLAIRLIIGRDFAVTRSSPEFCCDLFAIALEETVELKWLILNKHNR